MRDVFSLPKFIFFKGFACKWIFLFSFHFAIVFLHPETLQYYTMTPWRAPLWMVLDSNRGPLGSAVWCSANKPPLIHPFLFFFTNCNKFLKNILFIVLKNILFIVLKNILFIEINLPVQTNWREILAMSSVLLSPVIEQA